MLYMLLEESMKQYRNIGKLSALILGISACEEEHTDTGDTGLQSMIQILPENPSDRDDLVGYVNDYEWQNFSYYWYRGTILQYNSEGNASVLSSLYTGRGEQWSLSAYMASSEGTYFFGSTSVAIE